MKKYISLLIALFCLIAVVYLKYGISPGNSSENVTKHGGDYEKSLVFDGLKRSYLVHIPSGGVESEDSVPLVVVLHGAGGNAESAARMSQMNKVSDKNGFIVAYPNGTGIFEKYLLSWNAGECCNFVEPLGVNDVGFIGALVEEFEKSHGIDSKRVYVAGVSNGGMMAHRLGCELSDTFAAIAAVSSSMFVEKCEPSGYPSVVVFHNLDDRVIPFGGGESDYLFVKFFDLKFKPEKEAISFWTKHNLCQNPPVKKYENAVYQELYSGCRDGAEVAFYVMGEGEHSWPGGEKGWFLGGKPIKYFFASEIIWNFFEKHPKIYEIK